MNSGLQAGLFLAVAGLVGVAGFHFRRDAPVPPTTEAAASRLVSATLPDLSGKPQSLSQWRGKVLVVNFWATWCVPCREEIPALKNVQRKYVSNGVQIVGIAIDNASKVINYAKEMRIDYVLLIGTAETLGMASDLGNRAGVLPFTVVLNRAGKVVHAQAGALTEVSLGTILMPLL